MEARGVTEAELLLALREVAGLEPNDESGWRSTKEWAEFWGCANDRADKLLSKAYDAKILEVTKVTGVSRIGATKHTPVYRFKIATKEEQDVRGVQAETGD